MTRGELRGLIQTSLRELREGGEDGMSSSPRASTAQVQAAISTAREVWHSFSECIWLPRADWSFALWFPPSLAEESCSERLQVPCALLRDRPAVPWPVFVFRCTRVAQCFEYPPKRRGCSLMLTSPSRGYFYPFFVVLFAMYRHASAAATAGRACSALWMHTSPALGAPTTRSCSHRC